MAPSFRRPSPLSLADEIEHHHRVREQRDACSRRCRTRCDATRRFPADRTRRSRRDRPGRCRQRSEALEPRRSVCPIDRHDDPPSPFVVEWVRELSRRRHSGGPGARRGDGTRTSCGAARRGRLSRVRRRLADRRRSGRGRRAAAAQPDVSRAWCADLTHIPAAARRVRAGRRDALPAARSVPCARGSADAGRRRPLRDVHRAPARHWRGPGRPIIC